MPASDIEATRKSAAKNGAMKLHQSACALLPWANSRPGLPTSPQVSTSSLEPSDSTKIRSGSWAMASLNHCGDGGGSPL